MEPPPPMMFQLPHRSPQRKTASFHRAGSWFRCRRPGTVKDVAASRRLSSCLVMIHSCQRFLNQTSEKVSWVVGLIIQGASCGCEWICFKVPPNKTIYTVASLNCECISVKIKTDRFTARALSGHCTCNWGLFGGRLEAGSSMVSNTCLKINSKHKE